jgi:hypothetical protein
MKIKELVEAKDPHAYLEKKVHDILNKGDKVALLKKSDKDLVYLVQQAKDAGGLHYAKTQVVLPFVQSWRTKHAVTEGYTLKKTDETRWDQKGDPDHYESDISGKDVDYQIINNKTGKVVGTASWTTNDYFGDGALKITMNNGATRYLDIWPREKGNPQSALNRFMKDPKTSKKYTAEGVASTLKSALGLGDQTTMFTLQVRHDNGKWEDVGDGLLRHEAQDMLDDDIDAEVGVEYRAISFDKKEVLRPKRKAQPKGKDVLARNASPEVHQRNAEFFKKHL